MTFQLDPIRTGPGWATAALCESVVATRAVRFGVSGMMHKAPVAVLVGQRGTVFSCDVQGQLLSNDWVDCMCPGAIAEVAAASLP